jgi:hypothetical protein
MIAPPDDYGNDMAVTKAQVFRVTVTTRRMRGMVFGQFRKCYNSKNTHSRWRERVPPYYCFVASSRPRRRRASAGAPCPAIRTGASAPAGPGSRCCSRSPSRSPRGRRWRRPSRRPCSPSTSTASTTPLPSTPSCCLVVFWGRPAALRPPWCYSSPRPSLSSSAVQGRQYFGAGWRVRSRRCRKARALWRRPRATAPRRRHCKRPKNHSVLLSEREEDVQEIR